MSRGRLRPSLLHLEIFAESFEERASQATVIFQGNGSLRGDNARATRRGQGASPQEAWEAMPAQERSGTFIESRCSCHTRTAANKGTAKRTQRCIIGARYGSTRLEAATGILHPRHERFLCVAAARGILYTKHHTLRCSSDGQVKTEAGRNGLAIRLASV